MWKAVPVGNRTRSQGQVRARPIIVTERPFQEVPDNGRYDQEREAVPGFQTRGAMATVAATVCFDEIAVWLASDEAPVKPDHRRSPSRVNPTFKQMNSKEKDKVEREIAGSGIAHHLLADDRAELEHSGRLCV